MESCFDAFDGYYSVRFSGIEFARFAPSPIWSAYAKAMQESEPDFTYTFVSTQPEPLIDTPEGPPPPPAPRPCPVAARCAMTFNRDPHDPDAHDEGCPRGGDDPAGTACACSPLVAEQDPHDDDGEPVLTRADLTEWLATWDHAWECSSFVGEPDNDDSLCDCWRGAAKQVLSPAEVTP